MWGPSERLAGTTTDSTGHFVLTITHIGADVAILARAIGFSPVRLRLVGPSDSVAIRLTRLVTTLPDIPVAGPAALCPNKDSRLARMIWRAAAGHYWHGVVSLDLTLVGSVAAGMVGGELVGAPDSSKKLYGIESAPARWRHMWREIIAESGYAQPVLANQLDPAFRAWEYAPLETSLSEHFADSAFGATHRLSVDTTGGSLSIVFCELKRRKPDIEGSLALDRDSTIERATWRFVTPSPTEDAGGEVLFAPAGPDSAGHVLLLPAAGVYWRRVGPSSFFQRRWEYRQWSYSPHQAPTRKAKGDGSGSGAPLRP